MLPLVSLGHPHPPRAAIAARHISGVFRTLGPREPDLARRSPGGTDNPAVSGARTQTGGFVYCLQSPVYSTSLQVSLFPHSVAFGAKSPFYVQVKSKFSRKSPRKGAHMSTAQTI